MQNAELSNQAQSLQQHLPSPYATPVEKKTLHAVAGVAQAAPVPAFHSPGLSLVLQRKPSTLSREIRAAALWCFDEKTIANQDSNSSRTKGS